MMVLNFNYHGDLGSVNLHLGSVMASTLVAVKFSDCRDHSFFLLLVCLLQPLLLNLSTSFLDSFRRFKDQFLQY